MRAIHWIIVHQSASNNPEHDNIETIRNWHMNERNFSDIGYHAFINKCGELFTGRDEEKVGAHTKGHNKSSLGICLSGDGEKTPAQLKTLELWLIEKCSKYDLEKKDILGHKDLAPTECPGFDLYGWLSSLNWH
jgi:N-acetylmuramoyl-L-alanine amidase